MGSLVVKITKYHDYVNLNTIIKGCIDKNVFRYKNGYYSVNFYSVHMSYKQH